MRRSLIFVWLVLVVVWIGLHFGKQVRFREPVRLTWFHHCPMEWHGPANSLDEMDYVCVETGERKAYVYKSDQTWHVSVDNFRMTSGDYDSRDKAMRIAEDAFK